MKFGDFTVPQPYGKGSGCLLRGRPHRRTRSRRGAGADQTPEAGRRRRAADIGDNTDIIGRVRLLFDLIPLILATDSSRVVSVMIQDHQTVPKVEGVSTDQHNL